MYVYIYCPAFMIVEKVVLYIFESFDPTVAPPKSHYWLAPLERSLAVVN